MTLNKQKGIRGVLIRIRQMNLDLSHERIFQNLAYLGSGTFLAQILMAINAIILARYLGPQNFGIYTGTYAAVGLTSFFLNWGLDTWLLRESSISKEPFRLLGRVFFIKISLGIPWGILLFLALPAIRSGFFQVSLTLFVIFDVLFDGLFNAELAAMNAQRRVPVVSGLLFLSRGSRLIITILMIVMGINSPVFFAAGRMIGTSLALVTTLILFTPKFSGVGPREAKATFRQAIPYGFSELLAIVYMQADVTLIALLIGTGEAVGLYAPASGLINALFVIPLAGFYVLVPALTRLYRERSLSFRHTIIQVFAGFSILGIILTLFIWAMGPFLTDLLLGNTYQITGQLLRILSPILFLKSLSFACAAFLVAVGWQIKRLIPQAISAAANIILNLLVIMTFGILGVALVYVVSEVILLVGYLWISARWLKANPD